MGPLDRLAMTTRYPRRGMIYCEGDLVDTYFKVIVGTVRVLKVMEDGRRHISAFPGPGDYFGWCCRDLHVNTAEAATDVVLAVYRRRRVERLMASSPQVVDAVLGIISNQLCAAQSHLVLLGQMSARERVVCFLREQSRRRHRNGCSTTELVDLPMTRTDIADHLGLSLETVCRTMHALRREGLIAFDGLDGFRIDRADALEGEALGVV